MFRIDTEIFYEILDSIRFNTHDILEIEVSSCQETIFFAEGHFLVWNAENHTGFNMDKLVEEQRAMLHEVLVERMFEQIADIIEEAVHVG